MPYMKQIEDLERGDRFLPKHEFSMTVESVERGNDTVFVTSPEGVQVTGALGVNVWVLEPGNDGPPELPGKVEKPDADDGA